MCSSAATSLKAWIPSLCCCKPSPSILLDKSNLFLQGEFINMETEWELLDLKALVQVLDLSGSSSDWGLWEGSVFFLASCTESTQRMWALVTLIGGSTLKSRCGMLRHRGPEAASDYPRFPWKNIKVQKQKTLKFMKHKLEIDFIFLKVILITISPILNKEEQKIKVVQNYWNN